MTEAENRLELREARAARRLGRLFRAERVGRFEHRPIETVWLLTRRRAQLLDELIRLDAERRSRDVSDSAELDEAIAELGREVDWSRMRCIDRIAELGDDLRRRRAGGIATGLRDGADGRLLGRG